MSNEAHRWVMATMAVVVALAGGLCLLHLRRSLQSAVLRISMAHEVQRRQQPIAFAFGLVFFLGIALALLGCAAMLAFAAYSPSQP